MSLRKDIKNKAKNANYFIEKNKAKENTGINDKDKELLGYLNKMFYLDKNQHQEVSFVEQMITRGLGTQERFGLHASSIIKPDSKFCLREQVLSLNYKQIQKGNDIGLMRIFEEGNAIHEKWQRLFLRAEYSDYTEMDKTQNDERYNLSYTPDIICSIPEFTDGKMVGEIKSVNTFAFQKQKNHASGELQLQLYMYLTEIHKGFILTEDKNTQDVKVYYREYDNKIVEPFIKRLEDITRWNNKLKEKKLVPYRVSGCNASDCKRAELCAMRDACYNIGMGRVKLNV